MAQEEVPDDLVTETDAGAAIGRPATTIRYWRTKGKIIGYQTGPREWKVSLAEVREIVRPKARRAHVEPGVSQENAAR